MGFFYILGDIAWTFQSGTSNAWAVDNLKYGKHKKNLAVLFSRFFFFEKIGNILGALVGIILVSINFRFIWLAISLSNFIFTYVLIKYMEDKNFNPKKSKYNFLKETLLKMKESIIYFFKKKNKTTRGLALSLIFGVISVNSFYIIIPLVLKDKIGLLPYQISGIFFIIGVIVLIAPILGERFSRKLGYRKTLTFGTLLYAISMLFFGLFYYFIFSLLTLILVRFFLDGTDAIHESAVQHSIPSNCRATLGSAMSVMWGLSNAIAVYSSGLVISSYGLKFATLISFIFALITSLIYFKILKEKDEFKLS